MEEGKEEIELHFVGFLDKNGRIAVPLRTREEAGIVGIDGADVEVKAIVKKIYWKKEATGDKK